MEIHVFLYIWNYGFITLYLESLLKTLHFYRKHVYCLSSKTFLKYENKNVSQQNSTFPNKVLLQPLFKHFHDQIQAHQ